jgi:Winged helix DNA-binding domain
MATTAPADAQDRWLRGARMTSLLLRDGPASAPSTRSVAGVVDWFGAMQGQDLASVMWSLGLRTGQTRDDVVTAFDSGAILRTWPMRGTLHVVPGRDARWMLEHLGVRALRGAQARRQFLGLAEEDADRAAEVLRDALAGVRAMTRAECVAALEAAGIPSAGQRAYHLLWYASQKGVTCVGPQRGKEQTFVLLDEFAPPGPDLDRPEALATIAERFVRSHAPVSAHDLARWADLTVTDARAGLAAAEGVLARTIGGRDLFVTEAMLDAGTLDGDFTGPLPARALPGFDEFVLGYRDRSAQLDADDEKVVVPGGNGMFSNTLVVDGRVVGTWKRRELALTVDVVATPFAAVTAPDRRRLEESLDEFAAYLGKPARITWADVAPPASD